MESDLICFFVSGNKDRIFPDSELWKMPLSGKSAHYPIPSTTNSSQTYKQSKNSKPITIGDYLSACKNFLILDDYHHLKLGLKFALKKAITTNQLKRIDLYLEKHGAFYHPVKLVVSTIFGQMATLVLNGAVSDKGLAIIEKEYSILADLYHKSESSYLPAVFGKDILTGPKGKTGFFLGEWFDGFKEFHATGIKRSKQVVVWSGDGTSEYISLAESLPVYQKISKILPISP